MTSALGDFSLAGYTPHALHRGDRAWPETNCYADLWIELLHAAGLEPLATLGYTLAIDWEGDQWTFFKPSHAELEKTYGLDVQELNLWRSLEAHSLEQVARGNLVLAEVNAFFLPDTAGTDYQRQHTKTTIAIHALDPDKLTLGYFHNAGAYELSGADFTGIFRASHPEGWLPTYVEFVKLGGKRALSSSALKTEAKALLAHHLSRAPRANPVDAFAARFLEDVESLKTGALPDYHLYAFATLRQLGSAFDLASLHLRWLDSETYGPAAVAFERISLTAKSMVLKLARAVTTKKVVDFGPMLTEMAQAWATGMELARK